MQCTLDYTFKKSGSSKLISVPLWSSNLDLCALFNPSYKSIKKNGYDLNFVDISN